MYAVMLPPAMVRLDVLYEKPPPWELSQKRQTTGAIGSGSRAMVRIYVETCGVFPRPAHFLESANWCTLICEEIFPRPGIGIIVSTLAPSADEQRVSDAVKRVYDVWGASSPVARRPDSDPTVPPPAVAAVVQSFGALAVGGAADGSDASLAWAPHDEAPEAMERRRHRPRTSQGHSQQHSKHRHARRRSASEEAPPAPALAPLAPLSHQQHRQHPHRRHRRTESGGEEAKADTAGSGSTALTRQRSSRRHRERRRGRGERHRSSTPDPL